MRQRACGFCPLLIVWILNMEKDVMYDIEDEASSADGSTERKVYEIGFHLIPTIADEHIAQKVSIIKEFIGDMGGFVISEGEPRTVQLAYPMSKVIANKKHYFKTAYFGWIKFEMAPLSVDLLKNKVQNSEDIFRFIIISASRESFAPVIRPLFRSVPRKREDTTSKKAAPAMTEQEALMTPEELDKTIENLIIE